MSSTENTYNGWTNFETWKIGLEILDGWNLWDAMDLEAIAEAMNGDEEARLSLFVTTRDMLDEYVEEMVFGSQFIPDGPAKTFARDFIDAANFGELARSKIDAAFEEVRYQRSRAA